MPKKNILFSGAFIFLTTSLLLFYFYAKQQYNPFKNYKKINIVLKNKKLALFVADTPEKREKGLSGIKSIKDDQGMLFIFDKPAYYSFWMKDMQFPLDFIFAKDDKIVDLIENVKSDTSFKTFTSKKPADKVIEVKAGTIKNLKIKISEKVNFLSGTPSQN